MVAGQVDSADSFPSFFSLFSRPSVCDWQCGWVGSELLRSLCGTTGITGTTATGTIGLEWIRGETAVVRPGSFFFFFFFFFGLLARGSERLGQVGGVGTLKVLVSAHRNVRSTRRKMR
jgi:hypothetical protein